MGLVRSVPQTGVGNVSFESLWAPFRSLLSPFFFVPAGIFAFLLLIPLIIFYFLKLKRPRHEIASLALWRSVINDQRVNSPFQKFKRNMLLLLQLLLMIFLILAIMQPFVQSGAERAEYLPVLIDSSASMAATDKKGVSRLDEAKQQIGTLIDNMLPDQKMSLIAVDHTARRLTNFTDDRRELHRALAKLQVTDTPSKLEDALRMTQALSRLKPIQKVLIYSDGNFPEKVDFELPFDLQYTQLAPAAKNVGITAFNARRSGSSKWDVFVRIECSKKEAGSAGVALYQNGELVGEDTIALEAGESERLVFGLESDKPSMLEAKLIPDDFDSLDSDNTAFLDLPVGRPLMVYSHIDMNTYRHALKVINDIVLFPDEDNDDRPSEFDLLVTDTMEDANRITSRVTVFVGVTPPEIGKLIDNVKTGSTEIIDWKRSSPLLQHLQLAEVLIYDEPTLRKDVSYADFEELGYEILAHGKTAPLILKKRSGDKLAYYILFHTDRSLLPYLVAFPVMVANMVEIALHEASLSEVRGNPTKSLPDRIFESEKQYQIITPEKSKKTHTTDSDGVLSGIPATTVGRYSINDGGDEVAQIGVSLLNAKETSLLSFSKIQFKELEVGATEKIDNDRPLWPILALCAFCFLIFEWWYYQKKPAGVPT